MRKSCPPCFGACDQGHACPEFDATSLHRIPAPAPKEIGSAWLAVILVSLGCFLLYALIVYLDASKGAAS